MLALNEIKISSKKITLFSLQNLFLPVVFCWLDLVYVYGEKFYNYKGAYITDDDNDDDDDAVAATAAIAAKLRHRF